MVQQIFTPHFITAASLFQITRWTNWNFYVNWNQNENTEMKQTSSFYLWSLIEMYVFGIQPSRSYCSALYQFLSSSLSNTWKWIVFCHTIELKPGSGARAIFYSLQMTLSLHLKRCLFRTRVRHPGKQQTWTSLRPPLTNSPVFTQQNDSLKL